MAKKLDEIHPGEILLEEFIKPIGITNARLASDIDVPISRISENRKRQAPDHGRYGGTSWRVLQDRAAFLAEPAIRV